MKYSNMLMAGVALAFLAGSAGTAFAQAQSTGASDENPYNKKKVSHGRASKNVQNDTYRPLTVSPTGVAPVDAGVGVAGAGLGVVGGVLGGVGGAAGDILGGSGGLVTGPIGALSGGGVGISGDIAPPIPIKAQYEHTGAVSDSVEEGYNKPIPVDKSGPIYELDNSAKSRVVTPFSLIAFPIEGAASIATSPFRGTPGGL